MESPGSIDVAEIGKAIRIVQNRLIWKPESAERHLHRRIKRGHLPVTTRLTDYESIIQTIVHQQSAKVYLYWHSGLGQLVAYIAVVAEMDDKTWMVMFDFAGTLESAYVVERPHYYLSEPEFEQVCQLGDI